MAAEGFLIEIPIPGNITHGDMANLQKCEGRVIFLKCVRRRACLSEIDYSSYFVNGSPPDTLMLMAEYRRRFAAVITRILPGKITAAVLGVGSVPAGLALQNTGPFDLRNGDSVCFLAPIIGQPQRLRLDSIGAELIFPLTVPSELFREVMAKVLARAAESVGGNVAAAQPANGPRGPLRGSDTVYHNGRVYAIAPILQNLEAADSAARTLFLNMLFSVNEGCMLLFSLIPNLLTLGAHDGYTNALVQLESATRAVGQLIRPPVPQPAQDGERRFPVYEALASWLNMVFRLGDDLSPRPMLRVCSFGGASTIRAGETAPVIANWF